MLSPKYIWPFPMQIDRLITLIWSGIELDWDSGAILIWFSVPPFSANRALPGFRLKAWQVSIICTLKYREIHFYPFHNLSLALEPPIACSFKIWQTPWRGETLVIVKSSTLLFFFNSVSLPRPSLILSPNVECANDLREGDSRQLSVHLESVLLRF